MAIDSSIKDSIRRVFGVTIGVDMPEPALVYSDDTPPERVYGSLGAEEIEAELAKLRDRYTKQFPNLEDWIWRLTGPEAKWFVRGNQYPELQDLVKDVKAALGKERVVVTVAGQYNAANNRITIFNRAFTIADPVQRAAEIRKTIAHETLHAVHHHLAPAAFSDRSSYALAVREALADFYAYLFCLDWNAARADGTDFDVSRDVADELFREWDRYIGTAFPYHNAIFHMYRAGGIHHDHTYSDCEANGDVQKMLDVLNRSKTDRKDAYETLVPPEYRRDDDQTPRSVHPRADGKYLVVRIKFSDAGKKYSYLYDPDDPGMILAGDLVKVYQPYRGPVVLPVIEVKECTLAEYEEECRKIGYRQLGIVKKA